MDYQKPYVSKQRISNDFAIKSLRKDFRQFGRTFTLVVISFITAALLWLLITGTISSGCHNLYATFITKARSYLKESSFCIKNVFIQGAKQTKHFQILDKLNIHKNQIIFDINLDNAVMNISELPWIKDVHIKRQLPDTLLINLVEMHPICFWLSSQDNLYLVDNYGQLINKFDFNQYPNFIITSGKNAPQKFIQLKKILKNYPKIYNKVTHAMYIDNYRWDIIINKLLKIQLPANNIKAALDNLSELNKEDKLQESLISTIDIRSVKKIYFYPHSSKITLRKKTETHKMKI